MFADKILRIIEDELKQKEKFSNIVPYDEVFPTSGETFLRLSGVNEKIEYGEQNIKVLLAFQLTCSKRIQTHQVQNRKDPYLELIHLSESAYTFICTSANIINNIRNEFQPPLSTYGNITSAYLNLMPQKLFPEDYYSTENAERGPVGMKLDQDFLAPVIEIPTQCGQLPESLSNFFL